MSFVFETVPHIECQPGAINHLGRVLRDRSCRRPLIVTDPGLEKSGLLEEPLRMLAAELEAVTVYAKVQADPPEQIVAEALALANERMVDSVIGFGGGSSLDTAKLVALLARSPQRMDALYGIGFAKGPRLPLILVPTTAGTGSEVTPIAVFTTPSSEKKGIVAPQLLADVALLDPDLTLGLPRAVTAATGVDAIVHAIEAYTSRHLKNPVSDALAVQALRLLHANLRKVLANGQDRVGRQAMLEGSLLAGMAFANAPVAAVHALALPLGAHFHLPHGVCNGVMLPHVLAFNLESDPELYAQLAEVIVSGALKLSRPEAARAFLREIQSVVSDSGILTRLRDANVPESVLPALAADAMKQERLLRNNPRTLTVVDALGLYRRAW